MMRRRGGGGNQSSSSGMNSPNYNRQYDSNIFSNERFRTILLTSSVWIVILSISLFIAIRYYSSPNCPQNNLVQSI